MLRCNPLVREILSGNTILLIEGYNESISVVTGQFEHRNVEKSENETVIKGPKESFIESCKVNRSLVRKQLKSQYLVTENVRFGKEQNNEVSMPLQNEDEYLAGEVDKQGGNPTQMIGSAVIKDRKMIATLTGEETRTALLLRPDSKVDTMLTSYKDPLNPNYRVSARLLKKEQSKVEIDHSNETPDIHVTVPVDVQVINIPSKIDYVENLKNQEILKKAIEKQLSTNAKQLLKRSQKEFKSELFLWEYIIRQKLKTWENYKKYNWEEKYSQAKISVKFEVEISRFGTQLSPVRE